MTTIGRYQLKGKLGKGNMGAVYLAEDPRLGRDVAIKIISFDEEGESLEDLLHRFRLEARAAASLKHGGIVTIHDFSDEGQNAYIVMELIDGSDLKKILKAGVAPERAIDIVEQAAKALDFAHARGVYHRDIKPANLMVDREGQVKLMDFGIAKVEGLSGVTKIGFVMGSPLYMPGEALRPKPDTAPLLDRRDQYSLGVVAFEMFAGTLPFVATTTDSRPLETKIVNDPPSLERLSERGFPDPILDVFARVLNKDPMRRYSSCTDFASALADTLGEGQWLAVKDSTDATAIRAYADRFPRSRFSAAAHSRISILAMEAAAWPRISSAPSIAALTYFLDTFPNGGHAGMARKWLVYLENEGRDWEATRTTRDQKVVRGYLERHPAGPNREKAVDLLGLLEDEELAWRGVGVRATEDQLIDFTSRFANGMYGSAAAQALRALREESVAWQWVRGTNDPERLREFLRMYGDGQFAEPAEQALKWLAAEGTVGRVRVNPKDGLRYLWIPPGQFRMGRSKGDDEAFPNERNAHDVVLTKGFWLGETPVTQAAWRKVMGADADPSHFRGDDLPVESVTWDEANAYCDVIGGRLPTEAEWEYAARAGTLTSRYGELDEIAWHDGNSGRKTQPAGTKKPNAFGLYDMLGNVWEWCADWYQGEYPTSLQTDPTGPDNGAHRVLRGGSWLSVPRNARLSVRNKVDPGYRDDVFGCRCVWK